MDKKITQFITFGFMLSLLIFLMAGCYNDSKEYLYPELPGACDTTNITYAGSVQPIIDSYCKSCHSGSSPSGNLVLETYSQVKAIADDGRLVNVINATNGYPLMPQGSSLPDCSIQIFEKWVASGAPNN